MEEKNTGKASLLIFFLVILIIVILAMGYFLYKIYSEKTEMELKVKKSNSEIAELKNEIDSINNNDYERTKMSFSKIMDMMYTKTGTKVDENNSDTYLYPSESVFMTIENTSENKTDLEYTEVIYNSNKEITFNMNKVEPNKHISEVITGISEEVVDIEILQVPGGATPSYVYFLTRNGNIYYIDEAMVNENNFVAKEVTELKEVVSIEKIDIVYPDAMEGSVTVIATTYEGEKINILNKK